MGSYSWFPFLFQADIALTKFLVVPMKSLVVLTKFLEHPSNHYSMSHKLLTTISLSLFLDIPHFLSFGGYFLSPILIVSLCLFQCIRYTYCDSQFLWGSLSY